MNTIAKTTAAFALLFAVGANAHAGGWIADVLIDLPSPELGIYTDCFPKPKNLIERVLEQEQSKRAESPPPVDLKNFCATPMGLIVPVPLSPVGSPCMTLGGPGVVIAVR